MLFYDDMSSGEHVHVYHNTSTSAIYMNVAKYFFMETFAR